MYYKLPLLESGTLGTKGNVQVLLFTFHYLSNDVNYNLHRTEHCNEQFCLHCTAYCIR